MVGFHLAQINVARLRAPIGDPLVAEFVAALDEVNALAEASPGFVWRLQTPAGNATDLRVADDELLIVNESVWTGIEALAGFVYRSAHAGFLRRRRTWFTPLGEAHTALWWVEAGTVPTLEEGVERLDHLRRHGPGPRAFTFRDPYGPDGGPRRADDGDASAVTGAR